MTYGQVMAMRPPWVSVVETAAFISSAEGLLSADERRVLGNMLAQDPTCGAVMPGTGGIRKVRVAVGNRGKSGGARVVYFFHNETMPLFLVAIFAKNEKANLSSAEKNALKKFCKDMVKDHEKKTRGG